ncbi:MAG: hypothetical protein H7833_05390 [Magnetococcus sp. DMHC-1]
MARSKRKHAGKAVKSVQPMRPEDGTALLQDGRWRQAIDFFKPLAKEDAQYREPLIKAYQGRAQELAGKGMFTEAVAMLENTLQLGGPPLEPTLYFPLLMQAKWVGKGVGLLLAEETSWRNEFPDLWEIGQEWLAVLLLTGDAEALRALPEKSPLPAQRDCLLQAMAAWQKGDDATAGQKLREVPLRSPFRRGRIVLQALLEPDAIRAGQLLDAIPRDSLLTEWADVIRSMRDDPARQGTVLQSLSEPGFRLAGRLLGMSEHHQSLFRDIAGKAGEPKEVFTRILKARNPPWSPQEAEQVCLALLPFHPSGMQHHEKQFGPLVAWQRYRLQAIHEERAGLSSSAVHGWNVCAEMLRKDSDNQVNRLRMAVICRHVAQLLRKSDRDHIPKLKESLDHDPEHRETWLAVLASHAQDAQPTERRHWVDRALHHFPQDTAILEAAMDLALATKAFKKAANLARKILEQDPIHGRVRVKMIRAHLAHARKQMKAGRQDLAEKEVEQARTMDRADAPDATLTIFRALLATIKGDQVVAGELLSATGQSLHLPLGAAFLAAVEARRLHLPISMMKNYQNSFYELLKTTRELNDLGRMVEIARESMPVTDAAVKKVLEPVQQELQRLARGTCSRQTFEMLCEFWLENDLFDILRIFAKQGSRPWPDQPVWVYYEIYAKTRGIGKNFHLSDLSKLKMALQQTRDANDYRLAERIHRFVRLLDSGSSPFRMPFFGDFDEGDEDDFDEDASDDLDASSLPPDNLVFMMLRVMLDETLPGWRRKERSLVRNLVMELLGKAPLPEQEVEFIVETFLDQEMAKSSGEPSGEPSGKPSKQSLGKPSGEFPGAPSKGPPEKPPSGKPRFEDPRQRKLDLDFDE